MIGTLTLAQNTAFHNLLYSVFLCSIWIQFPEKQNIIMLIFTASRKLKSQEWRFSFSSMVNLDIASRLHDLAFSTFFDCFFCTIFNGEFMSIFLVERGDLVLSLFTEEMFLWLNNCLGCGARFFFGSTVVSLSEK